MKNAIDDFSAVLEIDSNHINAAYARGACMNKIVSYCSLPNICFIFREIIRKRFKIMYLLYKSTNKDHYLREKYLNGKLIIY